MKGALSSPLYQLHLAALLSSAMALDGHHDHHLKAKAQDVSRNNAPFPLFLKIRNYSLVATRHSILSNLVHGAGSLSQRTKRYLQTLNLPYGKKTEEYSIHFHIFIQFVSS